MFHSPKQLFLPFLNRIQHSGRKSQICIQEIKGIVIYSLSITLFILVNFTYLISNFKAIKTYLIYSSTIVLQEVCLTLYVSSRFFISAFISVQILKFPRGICFDLSNNLSQDKLFSVIERINQIMMQN